MATAELHPSADSIALPKRRADLILRPVGSDGCLVVKDPRSGRYFQLGEEESFLLIALDGEGAPSDLLDAIEERFGDPLSLEELYEFFELAQSRGFLERSPRAGPSAWGDDLLESLLAWPIPGAGPEPPPATSSAEGEEDDEDD
ncbi:MAG: PqqD family protein, partial [Isosphaeraceae bacterium]